MSDVVHISNYIATDFSLIPAGLAHPELKAIRAPNTTTTRKVHLCSEVVFTAVCQKASENAVHNAFMERMKMSTFVDKDTGMVYVAETDVLPVKQSRKEGEHKYTIGRTIVSQRVHVGAHVENVEVPLTSSQQKSMNMLSLAMLPRQLRNTFLILMGATDVDMVSAHPNILRSMLAYAGERVADLDVEPLNEYCDQREQCLAEVQEYYGCNREAAKCIVLTIMYGGGPRCHKLKEDHGLDMSTFPAEKHDYSPFLQRFKQCMTAVSSLFVNANTERYAAFAAKRPTDKPMTPCAWMSMVVQTVESVINATAIHIAHAKYGVTTHTDMKDGFAAVLPREQLLAACAEACQRVFGEHNRVTHVIKPYEDVLRVDFGLLMTLNQPSVKGRKRAEKRCHSAMAIPRVHEDDIDRTEKCGDMGMLPIQFRYRDWETFKPGTAVVEEYKNERVGVTFRRQFEFIQNYLVHFVVDRQTDTRVYAPFNTHTGMGADHGLYVTEGYNDMIARTWPKYRFVHGAQKYLTTRRVTIEGETSTSGKRMPDITGLEYVFIDPRALPAKLGREACFQALMRKTTEHPQLRDLEGPELDAARREQSLPMAQFRKQTYYGDDHSIWWHKGLCTAEDAVELWLNDPFRPEYSMVVNVPDDAVEEFVGGRCPRSAIINTWQNPIFHAEHEAYEYTAEQEAACTFIEEFLEGLMGTEMSTYYLDKLACMVQRPGTRDIHFTMLVGEQRIGKNAAVDLVRAMLGAEYVLETSSIEKVFGKFNAQLRGKLAIVLDEANWAAIPVEQFRTQMTSSRIQLEAKGKDVVEDFNAARMFGMSNCMNVSIGGQEQFEELRKVDIRCSSRYKNNTEFFAELYKYMQDRGVMRCFYHRLMKRKYEATYDPKKVVRSSAAVATETSGTLGEQFIFSELFVRVLLEQLYQPYLAHVASAKLTGKAFELPSEFKFQHATFVFPIWGQWARFDADEPHKSNVTKAQSELTRISISKVVNQALNYHGLVEECGTTGGSKRYKLNVIRFLERFCERGWVVYTPERGAPTFAPNDTEVSGRILFGAARASEFVE